MEKIFTVDALMFCVFLLGSLSGVIFWLGTLFSTPESGIRFQMHRGTGAAMIVYVCLHLALHGKWIVRMVLTSLRSAATSLRLDSRGVKGIYIQEY